MERHKAAISGGITSLPRNSRKGHNVKERKADAYGSFARGQRSERYGVCPKEADDQICFRLE